MMFYMSQMSLSFRLLISLAVFSMPYLDSFTFTSTDWSESMPRRPRFISRSEHLSSDTPRRFNSHPLKLTMFWLNCCLFSKRTKQ